MTNVFEEFNLLQKELAQLKERSMRINATVDNATQNADRFKEAAKTKFNVSTPEELKTIISEIDIENRTKLDNHKTAIANLKNTVSHKEEQIKKIQSENK